METLKQECLKAISKLSENTGIEEIMYRLYVIDKIKKGKEAVIKGETIPIDELKNKVSKW
ncbi:MAG: hypothetical protein IT281_01095 [Ignavibacteria bacterium]|nr:hypothetical protein [Ignavibacteria bacterium]MCC7158116.1 hypothetical protein [Ignavibacteria bacterium]